MRLTAFKATRYPDAAFYRPLVHYINSSSVSRTFDGTGAVAGENSTGTTLAFMFVSPFVSGRAILGRLNNYSSITWLRLKRFMCKQAHNTWTCDHQRRHHPPWTMTPLFYSQSTDLPVLRGRRCVKMFTELAPDPRCRCEINSRFALG